MTRRDFLAAAATATGAALAADPPAAAPVPIVDTHQHLWDLKKFRLPWIKDGTKLARDHLMSDYLAATAGLNVVKTMRP